ncbi:ATP-binding protein [archaeon]|nr:MAG: ATP-binding protein [archaeon]
MPRPATRAARAGAVAARLSDVKHIILVLSGKGGVGKSTFSSQLAFTLAHYGRSVGLLDVDICGPSIPRMVGLVGQTVHQSADGWSPVWLHEGLGVMSIGFMLPSADDAIIWRGPRKNGLIKQFLTDVDWGTLDYLIIDSMCAAMHHVPPAAAPATHSQVQRVRARARVGVYARVCAAPPGTSDEHISVIQYLKEAANVTGAVVVTTPQEVSMADVRKELNFCRKVALPVLGVVENMSGFVCPCCKHKTDIFPPAGRGPAGMAADFGVPFLGGIPLDPLLLRACEAGEAYVDAHPTAIGRQPFLDVALAVARTCEGPSAAFVEEEEVVDEEHGAVASVAPVAPAAADSAPPASA